MTCEATVAITLGALERRLELDHDLKSPWLLSRVIRPPAIAALESGCGLSLSIHLRVTLPIAPCEGNPDRRRGTTKYDLRE